MTIHISTNLLAAGAALLALSLVVVAFFRSRGIQEAADAMLSDQAHASLTEREQHYAACDELARRRAVHTAALAGMGAEADNVFPLRRRTAEIIPFPGGAAA